MLKNRHFQIRLVQDQEAPGPATAPVVVDPEQIVDSVVTGAVAIILVHKLAGLFCNTVEHIIVTKVR